MSYQSSGSMSWMSQFEDRIGFKPRTGQQTLINYLTDNQDEKIVPVKWPGGYGKTIGMALAYKIKKDAGICDRLLIVVANDVQRNQIINDFAQDCKTIGLNVKNGVWSFTNEPTTIAASINSSVEIFVTTIQLVFSTSKNNSCDSMVALMRAGGHKWMVACDEYHHYGDGMEWGDALKRIRDEASFVLALSATPTRDGKDTIFGKPVLSVSYKEARKERALKQIQHKIYGYNVHVMEEGELRFYTTAEIRDGVAKFGSMSLFEVKHDLRYTSKYIDPILRTPCYRLLNRRKESGVPFQMLVRAMSCKHAKCVCEQVQSIVKDEGLKVGWVGTGEDGNEVENNGNIEKFCPKKVDGIRPKPELDILVQVGMAGEGFDSILVAEIVDLGIVNLSGASNQTKQFYKRGTRWIQSLKDDSQQVCYINIPEDHPLSAVKNLDIELWVDSEDKITFGEAQEQSRGSEWVDNAKWLEPGFLENLWKITDVNLVYISDEEVTEYSSRFAPAVAKTTGIDPDDPNWIKTVRNIIAMEKAESLAAQAVEDMSLQGRMELMRKNIKETVQRLAKMYIAVEYNGKKVEQTLLGDINKRINGALKKNFGKRDTLDVQTLRKVEEELIRLEKAIRNRRSPSWIR